MEQEGQRGRRSYDREVPAPIIELTDDDTGRFIIQTASSSYVLDLDSAPGGGGRTLVRQAGDGAGWTPEVPDGTEVPVAELRLDGEPLPLVKIERCTIGHAAHFIV